MERMHKVWGERRILFKNDLCEVDFLKLKRGFRCSWHHHQAKNNLFYVVSGVLTIKTVHDSVDLGCGSSFIVPSGIQHEFRTENDDAEVLEIMYVSYDPEDILREIIGGPI